MIGIALLGIFVLLILFRIPIGWALAASSLMVLTIFTDASLTVGAQRLASGITPFPLLAIPLFIMAGSLMNSGGISTRLIDVAELAVGKFRGGLAQANVLTSLMFGGLSGSAVADVSSLGKILIPAMEKRDYRAAYSAVVTAAASVVGPILPPSITLIVYGVVSGTSISDLFMGGVIPAILYTGAMMLAVHFTVNRTGFVPAKARAGKVALPTARKFRSEQRAVASVVDSNDNAALKKPAGRIIVAALPALGMPVLILVGIRGGYFTPTEAAAMAVFYAALAGVFLYRELNLRRIFDALKDSTGTVGIIMIVLAAAQLYSWALSIGNVPQTVTSALGVFSEHPVVFLIVLNLLLIVVGMFIEANAAIIIITPLVLPIALQAGVDPVQLGLIIVVNMGIGLITPPVGVCLMLASSIAKRPYIEVVKSSGPFLAAGVGVLLLVTYVPQISLFLPRVLGQ